MDQDGCCLLRLVDKNKQQSYQFLGKTSFGPLQLTATLRPMLRYVVTVAFEKYALKKE